MFAHKEHRWAVDGLEEDTARVEEDGKRMISVPRHLLPPATKEGHVLRVSRSEERGGSVQITIELDEAATTDAHAESKDSVTKTMSASKKRDPGGDVSL